MGKKYNSMKVLVNGLNWTGSGAVIDLLREYKGTIQVPGGIEGIAPAGYVKIGEFTDFMEVGLVGDLLNIENGHPSRIRTELKRRKKLVFLHCLQRISNLIFEGKFFQISRVIKQNRQLLLSNKCLERLMNDINNSNDKNFRLERAQKWIEEIIDISRDEDTRIAVFDQPINFGQHDDVWPTVFEPYKLIVVCRDPRDQIAEQIKHNYPSSKLINGIGYLYGWKLKDAINFQIELSKARIRALNKTISKIDKNNLMIIPFEKIVLDYKSTKKYIQDFLGLRDEDHIYPKKFFKPEWSQKNIGIHKEVNTYYVDKSKISPLIEWYKKYLNKYYG